MVNDDRWPVDSDVVVRCCGLPGRLPVRPTCFFVNHASHRDARCGPAGLPFCRARPTRPEEMLSCYFHGAAVSRRSGHGAVY